MSLPDNLTDLTYLPCPNGSTAGGTFIREYFPYILLSALDHSLTFGILGFS